MSSFAESFTASLRANLVATTSIAARSFLFEHGYKSSSFQMPEYYISAGFEEMTLTPITNWSRVPITQTLDFMTPKGLSTWRRFSFIHPFIYWHIVDQITDPTNWPIVLAHLTQPTCVSSYTLPDFDLGTHRTVAERDTERWIRMAERDILKDADEYNYVGAADIQNFYPSIYTHSIAWALHGKVAARADKNTRALLGNRLDKLFQNARDGQTNGIPVGSIVSDLTAEIILTKIDAALSDRLREEGLLDSVRISRFRDDYRILGKTSDAVHRTRRVLNRVLHDEFDLSLNPAKSYTYDDVVQSAYRQWTVEIKKNPLLRKVLSEDLPREITFDFLRDVLIETYETQRNFPQERVTNKVLGVFAQKIEQQSPVFNIETQDLFVIIALLRRIILAREEVTPQAISILEKAMHACDEVEKWAIINELISSVSGAKDNDYQLIWIYRLCHSLLPEKTDDILSTFPDNVLLQLLNEWSEPRLFGHYKIFPPESTAAQVIAAADQTELEKVVLIDETKLADTQGHFIDIRDLSLIRY